MTGKDAERAVPSPALGALAADIACDLAFLATLHDREPDRGLIEGLRGTPCQDWFCLQLGPSDEAQAGCKLLDDYLTALPDAVPSVMLDSLAADYADLYLTYARHISPTESVWLTDDHLDRQDPMFAVRRWYERHGVKAPDWRTRPDDHLVHQLQFLAFLLREGSVKHFDAAGRFMDEHLLRWLDRFAGGMAQRAATPFYAGLGLLTLAHLETLRGIIEGITGNQRRTSDQDSRKKEARKREELVQYVPGMAPSW